MIIKSAYRTIVAKACQNLFWKFLILVCSVSLCCNVLNYNLLKQNIPSLFMKVNILWNKKWNLEVHLAFVTGLSL